MSEIASEIFIFDFKSLYWNKMGAAFLVTCRARKAEKAQLFFTTLLRRNLFHAAAALIIVIICGEHKQKGTGGWILCAGFQEVSCSRL